MNEKQQQLLFDKGITNVPSDALCSDNTLEESLGMIYEDGEHRVIQKPVEQMYTNTAFSANMLYIHKYNNLKRYVFVRHIPHSQTADTLDWAQENITGSTSGTFTGIDVTDIDKLRITSVGKTLIVTDPSGMHYYKWDATSYKPIGNSLPDLQIQARLVSEDTTWFATHSGKVNGILTAVVGVNPNSKDVKIGENSSQEDYNNLVTGLYLENIRGIEQRKAFAKPFFVRAALEMYDGTYTNITTPILLFPAISENTKFFLYKSTNSADIKGALCVTHYCKLYISQGQDYRDYSDLIKDVVLFVSNGIDIYDLTSDQPKIVSQDEDVDENDVGYVISSHEIAGSLTKNDHHTTSYTPPAIDDFQLFAPIRGLLPRESEAIKNDIEGTSIFYKIASLGLNSITSFEDIGNKTTSEITKNLTTQTFIPSQTNPDDYFSRSRLVPLFIQSYNSRLNIANASRTIYEGAGYFMPLDGDDYPSYYFDVTIKTESYGDVIVRHIEDFVTQKQGIYFYYPDSRASHVKIYRQLSTDKRLILDADLKEHPSLHGAYYFAGVTTTTDEPTGTTVSEIPAVTTPSPEMLPNYIIQSEVNNPFVFKAEGYFRVGTGKILGVSTITQALSEGQFGQFPLLVFSESGIWSLSVASTGYYDSIHPMSREVCNNVKSITQTDGAVFFTSEKGLMVVVGNQVKCVSEQLSGKEGTFNGSVELGNFHDFLKKCYIAYDYRDSLLWIFSKYTYNGNDYPYEYCWIYSMKSGTFGKYNYSASQVVNDYPDYLISDFTHFDSLVDRPNINLDTRTYTGRLITRPMKLENALALKSIMQIKHIKQFTPYTVTANNVTTTQQGSLTFKLFASNNLIDWVELTSLKGVPWKYYRFRYDFADLKATDRFAGTMLITQERRINKLR